VPPDGGAREPRSEPAAPPPQEEPRDLGFGSVVARESRRRLLNPDGSFNVRRRGLGYWESLSLYHSLLVLSWRRFLLAVVAVFLLANTLFAVAYLLCGPGALAGPGGGTPAGEFLRAFFFSVQTLATIGYGSTVPATLAANLVVTVESLAGLLGFALVTGLVFARFSRPTARILFSRHALIAPYHGRHAFEFRIANARRSEIVELSAQVTMTYFTAQDGERVRRFFNLPLERQKVVFFPLTWTIVHPIDADSPLGGLGMEELRERQAEFLVLLTGLDETFSQIVHARTSYRAEDVVWGARFANVFRGADDGDPLSVDVARLSAYEVTG
jgi:inward rectifier potassium channel